MTDGFSDIQMMLVQFKRGGSGGIAENDNPSATRPDRQPSPPITGSPMQIATYDGQQTKAPASVRSLGFKTKNRTGEGRRDTESPDT
jgi:hypothetical protein